MSHRKCKHKDCIETSVVLSDYCFLHSQNKEEIVQYAHSFITKNDLITHMNFSGINFDDMDFSYKKIKYCFFSHSSFKRAIFRNSDIISSFFDFSDLSYTEFNRTSFKLSVFGGADFQHSKIDDSILFYCNFLGSNVSSILFNKCDLSHSRFINSITNGVSFNNCNLKKTSFDSIFFDELSLKSSNCDDSILIESNLLRNEKRYRK